MDARDDLMTGRTATGGSPSLVSISHFPLLLLHLNLRYPIGSRTWSYLSCSFCWMNPCDIPLFSHVFLLTPAPTARRLSLVTIYTSVSTNFCALHTQHTKSMFWMVLSGMGILRLRILWDVSRVLGLDGLGSLQIWNSLSGISKPNPFLSSLLLFPIPFSGWLPGLRSWLRSPFFEFTVSWKRRYYNNRDGCKVCAILLWHRGQ